jgi:hypothetical protein
MEPVRLAVLLADAAEAAWLAAELATALVSTMIAP